MGEVGGKEGAPREVACCATACGEGAIVCLLSDGWRRSYGGGWYSRIRIVDCSPCGRAGNVVAVEYDREWDIGVNCVGGGNEDLVSGYLSGCAVPCGGDVPRPFLVDRVVYPTC
jgi:hypothetical protein